MALQTSFTFRFADIEVHEPELRVIRSGEPLAVEPKAFRVFVYLLRHAGHLVPKEELLTAVWGDTAVTDNSLARAIALLRHLLDDDPHSPRYIETVSTAGYRFICPVESELDEAPTIRPEAPSPAKTETAEPPSEQRRPRKRRWVALTATVVVLACAAGLTWYALRPLSMLRVASYRQVTSVGQWTRIAGTDGSSLYLDLFQPNSVGMVPVSGGRVVPLSIDLPTSQDYPDDTPFIQNISPDAGKLLVGSTEGPSSGRKFWIVDTHGSGARYVAEGSDANWSSDGRTLVFSNPHGDIYTIPREGGEPRLLLASTAPHGALLAVGSFAWSPDGSRLRFIRNNRYWEVSADGKNLHEILPSWRVANPKYLMGRGRWTPDGDFFLFIAGSAEFSQNLAAGVQIWVLDERRSWLHRHNPEPFQLTTGPIIWSPFVLSVDGTTVYCTGMILKGELVRYDAKRKELLPYLGGISAEYVNFSRDGKNLVYIAYPEGTMWRANRDGSGLQQLTGPAFYPIAPEWSPDGMQILFTDYSPSHRGEMYTISSQGGVPKRLLPGDKDWQMSPDWSPDGKKIVFDRTPLGTWFVGYQGSKSQTLDLNSGKLTDLPPCPNPCYAPQWSPNGRYILELATDHRDLMLFDIRTNQWSRLHVKVGPIDFPRWSHDGRSIFFEGNDVFGAIKSTEPGIYRIPVSGGRAEKVVDLKDFRGVGSLADGWSGLDRDDNPLLLRDAGAYDIYALALERK